MVVSPFGVRVLVDQLLHNWQADRYTLTSAILEMIILAFREDLLIICKKCITSPQYFVSKLPTLN